MTQNPTAQLLQPEVRELITEHRYAELRDVLHELPPADVAEILGELDPNEAALGFRFLQRDDAGEVFAYLPGEKQEELIQALGNEAAVRVVEAMEPDDRVRLLDELPPEVAQRIVASLSPENRRETQAILGYPPESVGRLMTPDFIGIRPEWTVAEALDHIRRNGRDAETINVVYVVDHRGKLVDDIRLRPLLLADPTAPVSSLMDHQFVALSATADQEEAVRAMGRYDRTVLPVIDSAGALLGIVTIDDVVDVAEEEATEDIQKLGGMEALEDTYLRTGHVEMVRKRGSWLSILFAGQSITILVLGTFQEKIDAAPVLAVFLPLVISCGGNSGSQASTLVTRALALGEVRLKDWWRIVQREFITAATLALWLGVLGLAAVLFFNGFLFRVVGWETTGHPLRLGLTVGAAIASVVLWGTVAGSLLPLVLHRFGIDPATASSPMVATLMDASGTLIYLGVAVAILSGTVL